MFVLTVPLYLSEKTLFASECFIPITMILNNTNCGPVNAPNIFDRGCNINGRMCLTGAIMKNITTPSCPDTRDIGINLSAIGGNNDKNRSMQSQSPNMNKEEIYDRLYRNIKE